MVGDTCVLCSFMFLNITKLSVYYISLCYHTLDNNLLLIPTYYLLPCLKTLLIIIYLDYMSNLITIYMYFFVIVLV